MRVVGKERVRAVGVVAEEGERVVVEAQAETAET